MEGVTLHAHHEYHHTLPDARLRRAEWFKQHGAVDVRFEESYISNDGQRRYPLKWFWPERKPGYYAPVVKPQPGGQCGCCGNSGFVYSHGYEHSADGVRGYRCLGCDCIKSEKWRETE